VTTLLFSVYRESNCDATAAKSQKGTFYFTRVSEPTRPSDAISDVAHHVGTVPADATAVPVAKLHVRSICSSAVTTLSTSINLRGTLCRNGIDQCSQCGKQILRPTPWTHFVNEGPTEMNCGTCCTPRLSSLSLVIMTGRQKRPQELVLNHFFDDFPDKETGKVECPLLCFPTRKREK
jgi:hypothetical protein